MALLDSGSYRTGIIWGVDPLNCHSGILHHRAINKANLSLNISPNPRIRRVNKGDQAAVTRVHHTAARKSGTSSAVQGWKIMGNLLGEAGHLSSAALPEDKLNLTQSDAPSP